MDALSRSLSALLPRDSTPPAPDGPSQQLLKLLQNPFQGTLQSASIWASLGSSIGFTAAIALAFSLVRPYNSVVYAPKLKHADEKHAPPPLGKGIFAWITPLWKTTEQDLVTLVGLDATVFMRFATMCRNMFLVLSLLGCGVLIPINYSKSSGTTEEVWLNLLTPAHVFGDAHWGLVVVVWLFNIVICAFLWWNYRKVLQLRRQYFESVEYQNSLHARTLMLHDIPKEYCSDEGISRIIDTVAPNSSFARTAIARNVKILPELIQEHEKTVRKLEKVLAVYLKDPRNLPPNRPLCKPSKKDRTYETYARGQKVDAIEYLTQRIKDLEIEIKEVRLTVDRMSSMPYGFASYADIGEAHAIAYTCRKKKPLGATLTLAPRPNDIIWDNMPLSAPTRSRRRLFNGLWVTLLTFLWIAPNAMIAIFLVNLANLGMVWPAFQLSLETSTAFWSLVQGIASPALTSLVYLVLPIIFRRLAIRAGDQTKTGRERHVVAKLYSFFIFNNLVVFSIFSSIWAFTASVVNDTNKGTNAWTAIVDENIGLTLFYALCSFSPFWVTFLLQRQLGAAIDLAQLWTLVYSFVMRKMGSPTPRELIELTAPPPFDYASYYNYFLFYATVSLCYASIQPLVLPAAALYFCIDVVMKKYLLLYVFVTKTESGGMFWRILFNRFIFGTVLANLVVFLIVWVRGDPAHLQAYAVAALPFLLVGFKYYCSRTFDDKLSFYTTRSPHQQQPETALNVKEQSARSQSLAARFGHPALYRPLITPMVHAKAQNILASVYQGRLSDGREAGSGDSASVSGYSDTYAMDPMSSGKVGKSSSASGIIKGFEIVPENRLDFEYYRNREEFAEEHGGGDIFGQSNDQMRPGTPSSMSAPRRFGSGEYGSRPGTPSGGMGFGHGRRFASGAADSSLAGAGTTYAAGYSSLSSPPQSHEQTAYPGQPVYTASPPLMAVDAAAAAASGGSGGRRTTGPMYSLNNDSGSNLVRNAAAMPVSPPLGSPRRVGSPALPGTPGTPGSASGFRAQSRERGLDHGHGGAGVPPQQHSRAPGMLGGGPQGYGGLPQTEEDLVLEEHQPARYDYFRGGAAGGAVPGAAARRGTRDASGSSASGGGYGGYPGRRETGGGQGYRG